jgi:hypothetical protein
MKPKGFFDPGGTSPYAYAVAILQQPMAIVLLLIALGCSVAALLR